MPDVYTRHQFAQLFKEYHKDAFPEGVKPEDYSEDELVNFALDAYPEYRDYVESPVSLQQRRNEIWKPVKGGFNLPEGPDIPALLERLKEPPIAQAAPQPPPSQALPQGMPKPVPVAPHAGLENPPITAGHLKGAVSGVTAGLSTVLPSFMPTPEGRKVVEPLVLPQTPQESAEFEQGALPSALLTNLALAYFTGPAGPGAYAGLAETSRQANRVRAGEQQMINPLGIAGQAALGYATAKAPIELGGPLPVKMLTGTGIGTVAGATPLALQQLTDTGTINWNDPELQKWGKAGGIIGGFLPLAHVPFEVRNARVRTFPPSANFSEAPDAAPPPPGPRPSRGSTFYTDPVTGEARPATVEGPEAGPQVGTPEWWATWKRVHTEAQNAEPPWGFRGAIPDESNWQEAAAQAGWSPEQVSNYAEYVRMHKAGTAAGFTPDQLFNLAEEGVPGGAKAAPSPGEGWIPVDADIRFQGKRVVGYQEGPPTGGAAGHASYWKVKLEDGTTAETNPADPRNIKFTSPTGEESFYNQGYASRGQDGAWARSDLGAVRQEILHALTGALAGGLTGGALGPEDQKLGYAFGGAMLGAAGGAGIAGALEALRPTRTSGIKSAYVSPIVEARLRPNSARQILGGKLQGAVNTFRREFGRTFETFYDLKQAGPQFNDAIGRIQQFNNYLYEIPQKMKLDLEGVFAHLKTPDDYKHFFNIVRLRRDIELMRRPGGPSIRVPGVGRIPMNPEIETAGGQTRGMVLPEAMATLFNLEDLARTTAPNVLLAADAASNLMKRIVNEGIGNGWFSPQTAAENQNYFTDYVLTHIFGDLNIPSQPAPGIRGGKQGYRKTWTGIREGAGTTLRSYLDVTARRLMEHYADMEKSSLVNDLGRMYDPWLNGTMPGRRPAPGSQLPPGYDWYGFRPNAQNLPTQTATGVPLLTHGYYALPTPLVKELNMHIMPVNPALKQANEWMGKFKGLVIRGQGPGFVIRNILGDHAALYSAVPAWQWPQLATQELQAIGEMIKRDFGGGSPLIERAQKAGIGASAAAAEVTEQVMRSKVIRGVAHEPSTGSLPDVLRGAERSVGNVFTDTWLTPSDFMRDWGETIPRLTSFIHELAAGRTDSEAGRISAARMVDYQDLTPREKRYFRGLLVPFWTFQKKTVQNYVPFTGKDWEGSRAGQAMSAGKRLLQAGVAGGALFALWNLQMYPEAEATLPPWLKDQPHVIVPYGWDDQKKEWKLMYLSLSGPANVAGRSFGMGNAMTRGINLATGRTDLRSELYRSGKQIREAWVGQVGPMVSMPYGLWTGEDLRTGYAFSPENATTGEKVTDRLMGTVLALPPLSMLFRAASEGRTSDETSLNFLKRATLGSLGGTIDLEKNRLAEVQRQFAAARGEDTEQQAQLARETLMSKEQLVGFLPGAQNPRAVPTRGLVEKIGPANTLNLYLAAKDSGEAGKSFAAGLRTIAQEMMQVDRGSWETPYRVMSIIQNTENMPGTALPEVAQKIKQFQKAKTPLFGK